MRVIEYACWAFFALCTIGVGRWIILRVVRELAWETPDWAAWVQAIGAITGIAIAIYVPAKQAKDAADAEESRRIDSARRICIAFRDELSLLQKTFTQSNVKKLLAVEPDGIFDWRIPTPTDRFPIYRTHVGRIAEIDRDEIRHAIIEAYSTAFALIEAGRLNNDLLQRHAELLRTNEQTPIIFNQASIDDNLQRLRSMCAQMQSVAKVVMGKVDVALELLAEAT